MNSICVVDHIINHNLQVFVHGCDSITMFAQLFNLSYVSFQEFGFFKLWIYKYFWIIFNQIILNISNFIFDISHRNQNFNDK